jgi:hypothetical protein
MCHICNGMTRRDLYGLVRSRILEFGYTVIHVDGAGPENPPFSYTVGLSRRDHPELIAFAMHEACAAHALDPVARAVLAGARFREGSDLDGVHPPDTGSSAALLEFPDSSTHLLLANEFYRPAGGPPIPALQILWPEQEPLLRLGRHV